MQKLLRHFIYAAATLWLALPDAASAQQVAAYSNAPLNLRAGPARDYPLVAQLPSGAPLTVMGCLSDYSWCDVAQPNLRGWVYAGHLSYPYQGANVPVMTYGTTLGLPIVTFSIGTYWGNYYRGRPWYRDQSRWARRPPPRPMPVRPAPPPNVRPPGGGRPPAPGGRPPGPGATPGGGARPPGNAGGARPPGNDGARPPGNNGGRPSGPGPGSGRPPGGQGGGPAPGQN